MLTHSKRRSNNPAGSLPGLKSLLAALLMTVWSGNGLALPDDREKPIHITADKAVRDEKRGITVYSGKVKMRQGSMELEAASLTIYHESQDANKMVARGKPAKLRQRPELDKGLVHAHANTITYFRNRELVHLRKEARLEREDGTLVTGDSIDYHIAKELVKAESDRSDDTRKVFVVIPPALIEDEAAPVSDLEIELALDPNTPPAEAGTGLTEIETLTDTTTEVPVTDAISGEDKEADSSGEAQSQ